jgi:hypothetical protein
LTILKKKLRLLSKAFVEEKRGKQMGGINQPSAVQRGGAIRKNYIVLGLFPAGSEFGVKHE